MNYAPSAIYDGLIAKCQQELDLLKKKKQNIAWLRLGIVIATALLARMVWDTSLAYIIGVIIIGIAAFLYAVSKDADVKSRMQHLKRLLTINKEELPVLDNKYYHRQTGAEFEPEVHPYANDFDVFGKASLYQYINRCTSEQGKHLLATHLLNATDKQTILATQEAVKEITPAVEWRQQLEAYGMADALTHETEERITAWLVKPDIYTQRYWRIVCYIYPVLTLGIGALYLLGILPSTLFSLSLLIFIIFSFSFSKKIHTVWQLLSRIVPQADTLYKQLEQVEVNDFKSALISEIKQSIQSDNAVKASAEIRELKNILGRFDARLNVFAFFFLNTFLLWDLRQLVSLNNWKNKNKHALPNWFDAIAKTELLSSLATLSFNNPSWIFPEIADEHFTLAGEAIGHPLIPADKRVTNSFSTEGISKVSIITGSNMGGKSTFLRSVGVNIVFALMGAPVCASSFKVSVVKLMSSMRIADNLADNTSTFYAELKKLRTIIESVNQHEKVYILLDEILRGTNSLDRHTGSKALIKQMILQQAVATIATHDVELAQLEQDFPHAISNYHFDVQVTNDELYFDYKLKPGICKSLNASILMKKIGIEL
ncbi:MAG: hypothetical protein J0I41_12320 [Filimonas sp.]|nr:hypothetical protein [Filimonas sp.]